ncbi:PadR family transcriptional regulator [Methanoplanus sp. FWC-SCC4]|uniref:PadR family transcriptional regulator n=1 Tax=Methanochimaera problematica TaxID=2609417 RepID=A0AA97FFB3_9EURY|nr:PadR family transcriptional regulator [Methanoplanus sp. FWC-SCC4]WOF17134.1 PadR family transcriptional regulator [Methanoplanus sp. FWC-SCC4]
MRSPPGFMEGRNRRRGRGLIQLYILHSLKKEPKSGYDILKEISDKTKGAWVPSKGTLYPMLKKMEDEGLITISETGKRSKNIFGLTEDGKTTLEGIIKGREEEREKMYIFRNLLFEIFGDESESVRANLMEIRFLAEKIPDDKQGKAKSLVKKCLEDLKRLDSDESGKC